MRLAEAAERGQMAKRAGAAGCPAFGLCFKYKVKSYAMPNRVYLDWNATTPLRPEARAKLAPGIGRVRGRNGEAVNIHRQAAMNVERPCCRAGQPGARS